MAIRVVVVDDHAVVRSGLRRVLEAEKDIEVVAEAGSVRDAVFEARAHKPDVIVMDVVMPGSSGIDGTPLVLHEAPDAKVLVLSMQDDPRATSVRPLPRARTATCSRPPTPTWSRPCARSPRSPVPPPRARGAPDRDRGARAGGARIRTSLGREREVLRLLALGHTNQEIAKMLYISVRTAESHRAHIVQKLRLGTRAELVRYALAHALLEEEAACKSVEPRTLDARPRMERAPPIAIVRRMSERKRVLIAGGGVAAGGGRADAPGARARAGGGRARRPRAAVLVPAARGRGAVRARRGAVVRPRRSRPARRSTVHARLDHACRRERTPRRNGRRRQRAVRRAAARVRRAAARGRDGCLDLPRPGRRGARLRAPLEDRRGRGDSAGRRHSGRRRVVAARVRARAAARLARRGGGPATFASPSSRPRTSHCCSSAKRRATRSASSSTSTRSRCTPAIRRSSSRTESSGCCPRGRSRRTA